jgi:hypothetical protein
MNYYPSHRNKTVHNISDEPGSFWPDYEFYLADLFTMFVILMVTILLFSVILLTKMNILLFFPPHTSHIKAGCCTNNFHKFTTKL